MKIAKIVGLVLLIAAAVVLIWTQAGKNKPKPGATALARKLELMDYKTLETVTRTIGEWNDLGEVNNRYKNSETGDYTMVVPMICGSCGEKIPTALQPEGYEQMGETNIMNKIDAEYICPKCGKKAAPRLRY